MKRKLLVAIASLALSAVPAAASHGEKGEWEFGPYAGFGWLDEYDIVQPDDGPIYGARVGYFFTSHFSIEASYQILDSETNLDVPAFTDDFEFEIRSTRLNFLWNFRPGKTVNPFLTIGAGSEQADAEDVGDNSEVGYNAGAGVRFYFSDHVGMRLDGRYVSVDMGDPFDETSSNFEGTLGILFTFGGGPPPDADNDGVPDRKDKCPGTPVGAKVDEKGCPVDTDGDGVFDGLDKCPDTTKGWPVDSSGCPRDTDGDGVVDGKDSCPDTPKGAKVDAKGCTMDTDGDGVFDGLDRCADTPKGAKVDAYGCPIDSDHDGVFDGLDQCPDTRHGAKVDEKGCEIVVKSEPLFPEGQKTIVLTGVTFANNSADITNNAGTILSEVAKRMQEQPDVKIEIAGHTDSNGSDAHNMSLSDRRAASVRAFLEAKGVDPSRMTSKGYGETNPVADNKTDEGRAKNRRVEMRKTN